eukprot:Transcript_16138.p1 GENE.Transcript_16138~~Transcript_16138.p1  ORF type:complete len:597 (+),score=270.45 Transcript_16138:78-1793(+)
MAFLAQLAALALTSLLHTPHYMSRMATQPRAAPAVASMASDDLALYEALAEAAAEESTLGRGLKQGLGVVGQALRLYGPDKVVTAFNGGKDAVVVLHLVRAALAHHRQQHPAASGARQRVIFFEQKDEFPEVAAFLKETAVRYNLEVVSYADMGFAEGIKECIAEHGSEAFVLGTRKGDPNAGEQQLFEPSSDWMPPFMRVNPAIYWDYHDVWRFLERFELPVCELYTRGYTSLGKRSDTAPNPALLHPDGSYAHARELADASLERAGRTSTKPPKPPAPPPPPPPLSPTALAAEEAARAGQRCAARTAGVLIVGDEILSGKTPDTNTHEAAVVLQQAGVRLRRVVVVTDELDEIARELRALSDTYDVVISSGGVGPTHDDVTLKAVAAGLGRTYEHSSEMARLIDAKLGGEAQQLPAEVARKMSMLPRGAVLRPVPEQPAEWPVLQCANVFVLPGVPTYFSSKLATLATHFLAGAAPRLYRQLSLGLPEVDIVEPLNEVVGQHEGVGFGSYPTEQGDARTIITLEADSGSEAELLSAVAALRAALPERAILSESSAAELSPQSREPRARA